MCVKATQKFPVLSLPKSFLNNSYDGGKDYAFSTDDQLEGRTYLSSFPSH